MGMWCLQRIEPMMFFADRVRSGGGTIPLPISIVSGEFTRIMCKHFILLQLEHFEPLSIGVGVCVNASELLRTVRRKYSNKGAQHTFDSAQGA